MTDPRPVTCISDTGVDFAICTLVTRVGEYREMVESFKAGGFDDRCEFLFADNSQGNSTDAFEAYNRFLVEARGKFIVLCHQDVLLLEHGRQRLERCLADLDKRDPRWGLCGNAGSVGGRRYCRISDPHGKDQQQGPFPAKVDSLDENFIVVRRDANLSLSHDLSGFHFYGADLCVFADMIGRSAYVIDFHLLHKSGGNQDRVYEETRLAFLKKHNQARRNRLLTTTCTKMVLSSIPGASRTFEWVRSARQRMIGQTKGAA